MSLEYDCLYRMMGDCPDCEMNYDPNDPMSNLYCERYTPSRRMYGNIIAVVDAEVKRNIVEEMKRLYIK